MPFIKSHSNYVLKSKHQDVSDGTIFERDITTIGAVDQFSPGQTPIYRSNNFIVTVRNDGRPANQYNTSKWKENDEGEIWTLQAISGMVSDYEEDNDTKIVLKQDYYDFRDFAYYGSLTELFRASVTDIIAKFPGELYITNDHAYYTVRVNHDFEKIEEKYPLGWYKDDTNTEPKYYVVSNPFNINLHSRYVPDGANPLRYFAEEGYLNYQIGSGETVTSGCSTSEDIKWCDITDVQVFFHDPCSEEPDIPFCDCNEMTVTDFDPNNCNCNSIEATVVTEDCKCNNIDATVVGQNGRQASRGLTNALRGESDASDSELESSKEYYRRVVRILIKYKCTDEEGNVTEGEITIYGYIDDNKRIVYMVDDENLIGIHIRPRPSFISQFYNEIDNFQKLLVNRDTNYKATFSVIRENNLGYYREFVPFQFPIGDGGYNLDATEYGFNTYTTQMVQIGEYYDENFTDNLWRSMTHEAIKNFDWTYTREYVEGDEEEYVFGGQRIQKALRIFGREFDEIISYINNIRSLNRITYDERGNLPDYFLTDVIENEGWDVKLVYPYELTEYYFDEEGNKVVCLDSGDTKWTEGGESCDGQLNNKVKSGDTTLDIIREFSQNANNTIKPYSKWMIDDGTEDGFFIVCNCGKNSSAITETKRILGIPENEKLPHCGYDDTSLTFIIPQAISCNTLYLDDCALSGKGALKNRIKSYTDEAEWNYQEVNNEFLRRLKLNSRYIWRHKGTIDGLEMILGMFGMKSKRWVEAQPEWVKNCKYSRCFEEEVDGETKEECFLMWDYDIQEYTSFANRIEETWDVVHQNYRINWINSTKTITYDNRFVSNYNKYGANQDALPYQGIPVAYREAYLSQSGETYEPYLTYKDGENEQFYYNINNDKIIKRYLYPYFDKNEELDGNPYFQMRGGWLSKMVVGETKKVEGKEGEEPTEETPIWNFQYNTDDQIVYNKYLDKGYVDSGFTYDNSPLYTETIRNIRRVDNVGGLLSIPTVNLYNGIICYVTQIEKNSAVVDNIVYPITKEWHRFETDEEEPQESGNVVSYVSLIKSEGFIRVGSNKFFDSTIIVYDVEGEEHVYNVEEMPDGNELKAYIKEDGSFICKEDESGNYSISNFQILTDEKSSGFTNYFILDDVNYADTLARYELTTEETEGDNEEPTLVGNWTSGWRRLSYGDKEYLKISTIINYYEGNNPHNGKMIYDNGHEYFTYFNRIFKYATDNDLFDERCYEDYYETLDDEITFYTFSGLVETNEDILQYDDFLVPDSKIHYFGNYKVKKNMNDQKKEWTVENAKSEGVPNIETIWIYGDDTYKITGTPISTDDESVSGTGGFDLIYQTETTNVSGYNLSAATIIKKEEETSGEEPQEEDAKGWIEEFNPYNEIKKRTDKITKIEYQEEGETITETITEEEVPRYPIIDDVTKQIMNNKIFDITFRLHNIWYTKEGQEELKYIDNIVMNYFTQMIPSTAILRVKYDLSDMVQTSSEKTDDVNDNG